MNKFKKLFLTITALVYFFLGQQAGVSENPSSEVTEDLTQIEVDCIFSVGEACRPSHYLKIHNLRFQAAPLDWMMCYSLETVVHLFETKYEDFFKEIENIPERAGEDHRFVRDAKNEAVSMHHFKKDILLKQEQENFRKIMLSRAEKVDKILTDSSSIGLICDRENAPEEFIDFITKFSKIYPGKKITLINVKNFEVAGIHQEVLFKKDGLKIIQFVFSDKSPDDPQDWKGNQVAWEVVMNNIKPSEKFIENINSRNPEL